MSGGGKNQKVSVQGWGPAMDSVESNLLPLINAYSSNFGGGQGLWTGSQLADLDPLVTDAQNAQLDLVPGMADQFQGVMNTLEGFLDYDPNSYQNQAARDTLGANISALFNESIRPGIEDRYTAAGQFGGPQQSVALGAATAPLSRAIADAEVGLMNADRQRAFQAMTAAPGLLTSQLIPSQIMGDVGVQRTMRDQQELADEIFQYEAPRRNDLQSVLELSGLLNPLTGMGQTTNAGGGDGGIFQGALGGALSGFGATGSPWGALAGGVLGGLGSL